MELVLTKGDRILKEATKIITILIKNISVTTPALILINTFSIYFDIITTTPFGFYFEYITKIDFRIK